MAFKRLVIQFGTIIAFGSNTVPEGYLLCNGSTVSRTTYAALFAVIGITYGEGDGSSTFALPNLTDRVLQGYSDTYPVGYQHEAGLPNIIGSIGDKKYGYLYLTNEGALYSTPIGAGAPAHPNTSGHKLQFDASRYNSIYGNSDTVQPPALTTLYCIKY